MRLQPAGEPRARARAACAIIICSRVGGGGGDETMHTACADTSRAAHVADHVCGTRAAASCSLLSPDFLVRAALAARSAPGKYDMIVVNGRLKSGMCVQCSAPARGEIKAPRNKGRGFNDRPAVSRLFGLFIGIGGFVGARWGFL